MREILFRGQTRKKGEKVRMNGTPVESNWVYGHGVLQGKGDHSIIYTDDPFDKFPVYTDTLGQYTGLTDKNGKKIFEGDLLNGFVYPYLGDNAHNYFAEVVWFDNSSAFGMITRKHPQSSVRGISDGNADYMEDFDGSEWEVIGNIHDNPELMGGESDG